MCVLATISVPGCGTTVNLANSVVPIIANCESPIPYGGVAADLNTFDAVNSAFSPDEGGHFVAFWSALITGADLGVSFVGDTVTLPLVYGIRYIRPSRRRDCQLEAPTPPATDQPAPVQRIPPADAVVEHTPSTVKVSEPVPEISLPESSWTNPDSPIPPFARYFPIAKYSQSFPVDQSDWVKQFLHRDQSASSATSPEGFSLSDHKTPSYESTPESVPSLPVDAVKQSPPAYRENWRKAFFPNSEPAKQ